MSAPTEPKVQAASLTAAVSGAALWLLGHYVFKGNVPDGIASMVYIAVPGVLAYAAGWLAPHQPRPGEVSLTVPGQSGKAAVTGNVTVQPAGYPPQEERLDIKTQPGM
jgi:hypothetical protein